MPDFSAVKVCVFDFDGTLVDTMNDFADLASSLMHRYYQIPQDYARVLYLQSSGLPFSKQVETLFPNRSENSLLVQDFERAKYNLFFAASLSDEVLDVLQTLRNSGFRLVVSSGNYAALIVKFLESLPELFHYVLGFDPLCSKGQGHFDYIRAQETCDAENMLFVADSLYDARLALDCSVHFVAKLGTFQQHDFAQIHPLIPCIDSLSELLELL